MWKIKSHSLEVLKLKVTYKEIKDKIENLNIVYSDVTGETDKKDILTALNKVEEFKKIHSDEKLLEHIKEIQKSTESRAL